MSRSSLYLKRNRMFHYCSFRWIKAHISRRYDIINSLKIVVMEYSISSKKRRSLLNKCMSIYTFIVSVPRSFLSFTFSVSSDDRSLTSMSFSVSASMSISGNFAIPNRLSCPMSLSKTYLQSHENRLF